MAATKITTEFYISTGKLNAMFTLRRIRSASGEGFCFGNDHYICNLAAAQNEELAIEKAREYFERMFDRMGGNTEDHSIFFNDVPEETPRARRGTMSARDTEAMEKIEAGLFPFGKHAGTAIADAGEGYIMYWVDQGAKEGASTVVQALSAACTGVALEMDYIARREAKRAARIEADARSGHVGAVGERIVFEGVVVSKFYREEYPGDPFGFYIVKVRCNDDLITYVGKGSFVEVERDQTVKFKATVKAHTEYKEVKETKISRPTILAA